MRPKIYKACLLRFIVLVMIVNLILLLIVLLLDPTLYSWTPSLRYNVFSEDLYVIFAGEGWVAPPPYMQMENIDVKLIIGNTTMDLTRVNLTPNITPVLFEFNVSREFRRDEFNISLFPDVKLYIDIKGYVPIPASLVTIMDNGCYLLHYYLPGQLNATINLCYFYINPTLTISNGESGNLEVILELHRSDGGTIVEKYIVKPHDVEITQYTGLIRPLIRKEKLKYMLFDATIEDDKSTIRLSNVQHIVFTVVNLLLLLTALISCRSRSIRNRSAFTKSKSRRSSLRSVKRNQGHYLLLLIISRIII
ncbi:MAG: hypothetical protein QXH78_02375 [Desulfurococcaceae archaeon]